VKSSLEIAIKLDRYLSCGVLSVRKIIFKLVFFTLLFFILINGINMEPTFQPPHTLGFPGTSWESKSPEDLGLDRIKLDQFVSNVGGTGIIVKDGYVVKTWGSQTSKKDWSSAAKPVIFTLLMFAIFEDKLSSMDDLIKDWDWDLIPKDQTMTFRHLANMVSGYVRGEDPGEAWAYNDYAVNLLGKTLNKIFQQSLNDAFLQRLGALQFEDGSIFGSRGGYGVSTSVRDFARIGWFWLNKGNWDGTQLLPKDYFDKYMKPGVPGNLPVSTQEGSDYLDVGSFGGSSSETEYGPGIYGFSWWFNAKVGTSNNLTWPDAPEDTFQANGHWSKEIITIIPSLNMTVAVRGDWGDFKPGDQTAGMNNNLKLLADSVLPLEDED
jgi:CubicO group peptidase (beta-lactamase class C family)